MTDRVIFDKEKFAEDLKEMGVAERQVCFVMGKSENYIYFLKSQENCSRKAVEAVARAMYKPADRYCIEITEKPEPKKEAEPSKAADRTAEVIVKLVESQNEMTKQVSEMAGAMNELCKYVSYIFNEVKGMRTEARDYQKKVTDKATSVQTHVMRSYEKLTHVSDKLTALTESLK